MAEKQFGELPAEVWPDGKTEDTDEYEYEIGAYYDDEEEARPRGKSKR